MSELMKKVYYNPSDPGSLGGKARLKRGVLQEYGVALKDREVTDWLAAQDAYTLHRTAPVKYKRNRVMVYGKDAQFQAYLVDISAYSKENDNIKFLLTCIDVFSKYAWARPLKNKTGKEVTKAFESILKENRVPQKLQTDKGTEFFNKHFQQLMKKYDIHHFAMASDIKASVVERFNRTLRGRMTRFLTAINSKRYYNILQDLIDGYNASYHKSIKMRPWMFIKKMKRMCLIICTERCVKMHLSLSIKLVIWLGCLKSEMCFLRDMSRITQKSFSL